MKVMVEVQGKESSAGVSLDESKIRGGVEDHNFPSVFDGLIFVCYLDHVLYNRTSALAMKPQVREAVGWLVYECEYYITITWDRDADPPTLKGGDPKASGLVLLKSDILLIKKLPLQKKSEWHLNSDQVTVNCEYCASVKEAKNSAQKSKGRKSHD